MKKVVVIGAGYGGLRAVESLAKYEDVEIILLDKNAYHYLQTEVYGYIAGRFDVRDVTVDLKNWCDGFSKKVTFVHAEAKSVDFDAKKIQTDMESIAYDYLIIATGARTNFFSFISGLREHSYGVKHLKTAYGFRQEFEAHIYHKLQDDEAGNRDINIAIGGAGLSGVEVAAEMAYVIDEYSKTIGDTAKEIHIYLIDASDTILPGMGAYSIKHTQIRLEALGVKIMTSAFIDRVDDDLIYFRDGESLAYEFMIFTGGIKASDFNANIDHEKNRINQFIVTPQLTLEGHSEVFGIGDCVEIKDHKGNILAPTAQIAEKSAEYVAKSIRKKIDGNASKAFDGSVSGVFIALGGKYAVGEMLGYIKVRGYVAYLLKKAITYAYYLGLRLRINTGFKNRIKKS